MFRALHVGESWVPFKEEVIINEIFKKASEFLTSEKLEQFNEEFSESIFATNKRSYYNKFEQAEFEKQKEEFEQREQERKRHAEKQRNETIYDTKQESIEVYVTKLTGVREKQYKIDRLRIGDSLTLKVINNEVHVNHDSFSIGLLPQETSNKIIHMLKENPKSYKVKILCILGKDGFDKDVTEIINYRKVKLSMDEYIYLDELADADSRMGRPGTHKTIAETTHQKHLGVEVIIQSTN
jgi:hypothetical protein